MLEFVNLKGKSVDFTSKGSMAQTFGSWMSMTAAPSEIVDWCNRRINLYARWTDECRRFKEQVQSVQMADVPTEIRLKGMTKEEITAYLATLK